MTTTDLSTQEAAYRAKVTVRQRCNIGPTRDTSTRYEAHLMARSPRLGVGRVATSTAPKCWGSCRDSCDVPTCWNA